MKTYLDPLEIKLIPQNVLIEKASNDLIHMLV